MLLPAGALVTVGVAVLVVAVRTRRVRQAVDQLVVRLAQPVSTLRDDLGGVIRAMRFAVPGDDRWVDAIGNEVGTDVVGDASSDGWVDVADEHGSFVQFQLAPGTAAADVVALLTPAAQLSLRNAQLAAVTKARLLDVQASRRRIVEASDAERQRIERDLHDGAQQRLVSAAFHLTLARHRLPEHDADVADAEANVRVALRNLRDLAHGIFPAVLASEGLRAGVEDLVVNVNLPTTLDIPDQLTISIESAMAAHATVSAALDAAQSAGATRATVAIDRIDGTLDVRIESDAPAPHGHHLLHVFDRVGAVGGELSIDPTATGSIVRAEIPCAS